VRRRQLQRVAVRDVGARFHLAAAALGMGLWGEWVNTKAQLADAPSLQWDNACVTANEFR
jgi:hypothetical protein